MLVNLYHRFGLGAATALGISGESSGYFPLHRQRWSGIERTTFSFGYGLRITPLQMARAYAPLGAFSLFRPLAITKVMPPVFGPLIHQCQYRPQRRAYDGERYLARWQRCPAIGWRSRPVRRKK